MLFTEPRITNEKANKRTVKAIDNAWKDATVVDNQGLIWVRCDKLHTILRTNKNNANYIVMKIVNEDIKYIGGQKYARGCSVLYHISRYIEENGDGTKLTYLEISRAYYECISSSDEVKNIRLQYDNAMKGERKKLKKKRMKKYNVVFDELTGEVLEKDCEFSHIRSVSMFKSLCNIIENGLLVNKDTHRIITEKGLNDEEELRSLCIDMGWNLDWYDTYKANFPEINI